MFPNGSILHQIFMADLCALAAVNLKYLNAFHAKEKSIMFLPYLNSSNANAILHFLQRHSVASNFKPTKSLREFLITLKLQYMNNILKFNVIWHFPWTGFTCALFTLSVKYWNYYINGFDLMTWSENGNSLKSTMLSKNNRKNDKIISKKGTKKWVLIESCSRAACVVQTSQLFVFVIFISMLSHICKWKQLLIPNSTCRWYSLFPLR